MRIEDTMVRKEQGKSTRKNEEHDIALGSKRPRHDQLRNQNQRNVAHDGGQQMIGCCASLLIEINASREFPRKVSRRRNNYADTNLVCASQPSPRALQLLNPRRGPITAVYLPTCVSRPTLLCNRPSFSPPSLASIFSPLLFRFNAAGQSRGDRADI